MSNTKDFKVKNGIQPTVYHEGLGTVSFAGGVATLDLSTGSVFEVTPTSDIQVTLSNPADSGTVSGATLLLDGAEVIVDAWDISTASYSQNFGVGNQESVPTGIFFKPDGTEMYIIGYGFDLVNQYTLSTAWDTSTASSTRNFDVSPQEVGATGVFFKTDGTKMYVCGPVGSDINEYTLSTAWNISTASYSQNLSVSSPDGGIEGMYFRTDGLKMYYAGRYSDGIYEYTLSTAWDISTASYIQSHSVSSQDGNVRGVFFKTDGTKMYVVGGDGDDVNEYTLSTAWDVSTASYSQNLSVSSEETNPQGVFFKPDGTKMYIVGAAGIEVNEYTVGSSSDATITYPSTVEWPSGTAPTSPAVGETDVLTFNTRDGGSTYQGVLAIDGAQ